MFGTKCRVHDIHMNPVASRVIDGVHLLAEAGSADRIEGSDEGRTGS